jgi:hypothetical protein
MILRLVELGNPAGRARNSSATPHRAACMRYCRMRCPERDRLHPVLLPGVPNCAVEPGSA